MLGDFGREQSISKVKPSFVEASARLSPSVQAKTGGGGVREFLQFDPDGLSSVDHCGFSNLFAPVSGTTRITRLAGELLNT